MDDLNVIPGIYAVAFLGAFFVVWERALFVVLSLSMVSNENRLAVFKLVLVQILLISFFHSGIFLSGLIKSGFFALVTSISLYCVLFVICVPSIAPRCLQNIYILGALGQVAMFQVIFIRYDDVMNDLDRSDLLSLGWIDAVMMMGIIFIFCIVFYFVRRNIVFKSIAALVLLLSALDLFSHFLKSTDMSVGDYDLFQGFFYITLALPLLLGAKFLRRKNCSD